MKKINIIKILSNRLFLSFVFALLGVGFLIFSLQQTQKTSTEPSQIAGTSRSVIVLSRQQAINQAIKDGNETYSFEIKTPFFMQ